MSVAKFAAVGLAIAALSACGSSHRVGLHDYSVQQVKRVFGAHGIPLHKPAGAAQLMPGYVGLVSSHRRNDAVSAMIMVDPSAAAAPIFLDPPAAPHFSTRKVGNVRVWYSRGHRAGVEAALAALH